MTPIIDVHAHVFSARDIPVRGYLRSRKDRSLLEKTVGRLLVRPLVHCIRKERSEKKTLKCHLMMAVLRLAMGWQYPKWVDTLSKNLTEIVSEMMTAYSDIDLYVALMIDYEYWFKNTVDNLIESQIKTIHEQVIIPNAGRIHPFVAFDPARELAFRKGLDNPDGNPEEHGSLKLVRDAVENKGFIGVKVYNSLGYRPLGNRSVDDERREIFRRNEWPQYTVFTGDEVDEVLSELYEYCASNEIPITAHCIMDGIEAYPKASYHFGRPEFWCEVLNEHPDLRLNLAHFGWNQKLGQGYHGKKSWVKVICRMISLYDHLYTDVSHHRVILSDHRRRFRSGYRDLCKDFDKYIATIKKRLLFGIDWHVIKRVRNYESFRADYEDVLKHARLFADADIADFLGGNALDFLGLRPGGANRDRLRVFYSRNEITPPKWFQAAGTQNTSSSSSL